MGKSEGWNQASPCGFAFSRSRRLHRRNKGLCLTTTILLIRHATHDRLNRVLCGRMPGVSINSAGEAQARTLVERLATARIAAIYSSPLERAQETAAALSERIDLPITVDPLLAEVDFGAWTGLTFEALHGEPGWAVWNTQRSQGRPPGGETIQDVQRRLATWLRNMAAVHQNHTIAAFSHADVIKAAVADILGSSIDRLHRFAIDPVSTTRIEVDGGEARVTSLNEVGT